MPALMTAGRWKGARMPARYTERQAAGRGAVARYYQDDREFESSLVDEMATMAGRKRRLWLATRLHLVNLDDRP